MFSFKKKSVNQICVKCWIFWHNLTFFSQEVPLLHIPAEVDGGTLKTKNINTYGGKGYLGGLAEVGGAAGGGAALGAMNASTLTAENMHMYNQYNHSSGQMDMDYAGGGGMMTGQEHLYSRYRAGAGLFDGMALSDDFLGEYYSSVSTEKSVTTPIWSKSNVLFFLINISVMSQ